MSFILTDNEKLALVTLVHRGPCSTHDMAAYLRCGIPSVYHERGYTVALNLLNALKSGQAATHGYGRWEVTERGRIAAALALFKEPKLQRVLA
jgi:hypothetical protein